MKKGFIRCEPEDFTTLNQKHVLNSQTLPFPRVHLCMENTLWFFAVITGSRSTLEHKTQYFVLQIIALHLYMCQVPPPPPPPPHRCWEKRLRLFHSSVHGGLYGCRSQCWGAADAQRWIQSVLALRRWKCVCSLARQRWNVVYFGKIVQKKNFIYCVYEWLADLRWTHNVVNIWGCRDNFWTGPLFVVTSECI